MDFEYSIIKSNYVDNFVLQELVKDSYLFDDLDITDLSLLSGHSEFNKEY